MGRGLPPFQHTLAIHLVALCMVTIGEIIPCGDKKGAHVGGAPHYGDWYGSRPDSLDLGDT